MASINQIQNAIIEMEGGKFQRLIDALLAAKGVTTIFSIGTVLGTDKTRTGTPDTMIITDDEISFIEYSTKQDGLYKKFDEDISKCLDQDKTGIHVDRIKKIILAYNSRLSTSEIYNLMEKCKKNNVSLEYLNVETISYLLFYQYPGLINDFLGLSIDTGQVVRIPDFIKSRDKNILAAKLGTSFVGRKEEKEMLMEAINSNDITIISGKPGLGKTRLAIECCEEYATTHKYNSYAIFDKGMNIFDDLQVYFSSNDNFLILVDDANKVSNYEYFIDLVLHKIGNIKLIVTVRDYAKDDIIKLSRSVKNYAHLELNELKNEEIEKIITTNYPINNYDYIDRILKISSGNTRLAIMASELSIKENNLEALSNVFKLYDAYYSSIIEELSTEDFGKLLGFAGLISFIKIVDFDKQEEIQILKDVFKYTTEELVTLLEQLHILEIVDAYENTIYKVSDQVLSTYLFYFVFMHKNIIDISHVFNAYFFKDNKSLIEIINSVASPFYSEELVNDLIKQAKELYKSSNSDEQKKRLVLKAFGGLLPNEVLLFFKETIESAQTVKLEYSEIEIDPRKNVQDDILEIASTLKISEYPIMKVLFQLIIMYVNKDNSKCNDASIIINHVFGLNRDNVRSNFQLQRDVVDWFILELTNNESDATKKIFIEYCKKIIKLEIEYTEWGRGNQVIFGRIIVPYNEYSINFRHHAIEKMFSIISNNDYKHEIIKSVTSMYDGAYTADITPFLNDEMNMLYNLLESTLVENDVRVFVEVSHLIDMYEINNIDSSLLENLFKGKLWELYLIIMPERLRRKYRDLSYDERLELKDNLIEQYVLSLNEEEVIEITHGFCKLYADSDIRRNIHDLRENFERFLIHVIDCSDKLILEVLKIYFLYEIEILYRVDNVLDALRNANLLNELHNIINTCIHNVKRDSWLFMHLKESVDELKEDQIKTLLKMFETVDIESLPNDIFYYLNDIGATDNDIIQMLKILMVRGETNSKIYFNLDGFFSDREQLNYSFMDIYTLNPELIGELYKKLAIQNTHFDYKSKYLEILILNDNSFMISLVNFLYSNVERHNIGNIDIDFDVVWKNMHFDDIDEIVRLIVQHDENKAFYYSSLMKVLFKTKEEDIQKIQMEYIISTIIKHSSDEELMIRLFDISMEKNEDFKLNVIGCFLKHNTDVDLFKKLSIESRGMSWSGSAVPIYQKKIDYLNKILSYCDTIDLLEHREYLQNHIDQNESKKESEKKKDFRGRW